MATSTGTSATPHLPTSRMNELSQKHRSILRRLDDLESRLASRVAAHRRRAMNVVEETPTSRRSHMRIFVSHRVQGEGDDVDEEDDEDDQTDDKTTPAAATTASPLAAVGGPSGGKNFSALLHSSAHEQAVKRPPISKNPQKGVRRWTLVIEGGLLIKHLDHESAKAADKRLDAGLPILGVDDGDDDDKSAQQIKAAIPLRDRWRGGAAELENEKSIDPLNFTHLFDKLEVEMKVVKPSSKAPESPPETTRVSRSGHHAPPEPPKTPEVKADVKTFVWERARSNAPDSNAFFIVHNEESEFKPIGGKLFKSEFKVEHIAAKIKLYRRQGGEANFVPSRQMSDVFFPTFIGKKVAAEVKSGGSKSSSKSKKRKRSGVGGDATTSFAIEDDTSKSSMSSISPGKEAAFRQNALATAASTEEVDPETDVHVPNTVTMDEALHAIFFYIRTRNLQDATDLSVINNDDTMSTLFGCDRMLFSAVRGLLVERQLLVKVEPSTHPIIFNYDMTVDGAEPLTKTPRAKPAAEEQQGSETAEVTKRRRTAQNDPEGVQSDSEQAEDGPHQTMLSCDVDCEVPNFFHVRTRDILRRTKYREYDYTSARIKALRSIVATNVNEETAKHVLQDVVAGKGYAPCDKQVWMALASGSQEGGEAQRAAWIDLRTTALIEKLEDQCSVARGFWDVANSCQSRCEGKK